MNATLKTLQIINTLATTDGGPARNAFELHRALNSLPHTRSVLVALRPVDVRQTVAADSLEAFNGGQLRRKISLARLLNLLATADTVIIHGYYLPWTPVAAALSKLLGRRVLLTPHGSLTSYQQRFGSSRKLIFDMTAGAILRGNVDVFAVGSESESADLARKFPRSDAVTVGVGAPFPPVPPLHVPSKHLRLLSISRVAPKKRVDIMIDTVAELQKRGVRATLTIAGSGDPKLLDELTARARSNGSETSVRFVGEVTGQRKLDLYATSDIFLAPSDDENFGIALAESLSNGVPCVASNLVASAKGLVSPAGIVLEDRSPVAIADAVTALYLAPQAERGAAARAFAKEAYAWSNVALRWRHAAAAK